MLNCTSVVTPYLTSIMLIEVDGKPLCLLFEQFTPSGSQASEHLVLQFICVSLELFAKGCVCVCPFLEGSGVQGNAAGLGLQTKLVGVIDLPLCSRVTFGQFLDLSESQVLHLQKLA